MLLYVNYNKIHKAGELAVSPAEIYDVVEIVLPNGFREVKMADDSTAIEWPDGQITLATQIFGEYTNGVLIPYIVDCSGRAPKKLYLKMVVKEG